MATLGNKAATQHVSLQKQTITGNGGTSYTLQQSVGSALDIAVFVNNTRQEPTTAYTATGTTLTMTGAVNASDHFYVLFLTKAISTTGLPVDTAISASTISSSGNTTVGGTLGITGNTTVGGTLGVTGTTTLSGAANLSSTITTSTGHNLVPEFISNGQIAGNSATSMSITDAIDTTKYAVHRVIGSVGGSHGTSNAHAWMRFLKSGDGTAVDGSNYSYALDNDTGAGSGGTAEQNVTYWRVVRQVASTLSANIDMYIYVKSGNTFMHGASTYWDNSSNRGWCWFGGVYYGTDTPTGLYFSNSQGDNTSAMNVSVYGYRARQNSSGKFTGSVSI